MDMSPSPEEAITPTVLNSGEKKAKAMLQQIEMTMMQQRNKSSLDISALDKEQKDKLLDIMEKNENNAFEYSKKQLEVHERINVKMLEASIVDQKTLRYVLWGGGASLVIVMVLILFFKENYFVPYLTFVTGLIGGMGLKSVLPQMSKPSINNNNDDKDNDE